MEILVTGILTGLLCVATTVIFVLAIKESDCHCYKETMEDRKVKKAKEELQEYENISPWFMED